MRSKTRWTVAAALFLLHAAPLAAQLRFEPHALRLSDGREVAVERAMLRVPERRAAAEGDSIEVALIRLRGAEGSGGTPIVYLNGDPGGSAASRDLRVAALYDGFARLTAAGEVIVMDYRGTGLSTPRLACPAVAPPPEMLRSRETMLAGWRASAERCRRHLDSLGVDLRGYTWEEVADDVRDLADALGAPRVRLLGFSSGTHAALATIRRHEARVERAVLVGTEGMDQTRKLPSNVDRQLGTIGGLAAADPALEGRVPDLVGLMGRVLEGLETRPATVEIVLPDSQRVRGEVGAFALRFITSKSLSGPGEFGIIPRLYHTLERGDLSLLTRIVQGFGSRPPASPLAYVMDGSAGVSEARWRRIEAEAEESVLGNAVNFPFPETRAAWGYGDLGDAYRRPVRSATPVLFVTGSLDGNTPPHQAEEVRAGFPNGAHLIVENGGHGSPFFVNGALDAMARFLADGTLPREPVVLPPPSFAPLGR